MHLFTHYTGTCCGSQAMIQAEPQCFRKCNQGEKHRNPCTYESDCPELGWPTQSRLGVLNVDLLADRVGNKLLHNSSSNEQATNRLAVDFSSSMPVRWFRLQIVEALFLLVWNTLVLVAMPGAIPCNLSSAVVASLNQARGSLPVPVPSLQYQSVW